MLKKRCNCLQYVFDKQINLDVPYIIKCTMFVVKGRQDSNPEKKIAESETRTMSNEMLVVWNVWQISWQGMIVFADPLLTKDSYGKTTNLRLYTNVAFDWLSIITWSCRNRALIGIQKIQSLILQISSLFFGKSHFLECFLWKSY